MKRRLQDYDPSNGLRFFAEVTYEVHAKNKLQEAIAEHLKQYHRRIYEPEEFVPVATKILFELSELNEQYKRCTPEKAEIWNQGYSSHESNDWVLDIGFRRLNFKAEKKEVES